MTDRRWVVSRALAALVPSERADAYGLTTAALGYDGPVVPLAVRRTKRLVIVEEDYTSFRRSGEIAVVVLEAVRRLMQ